MSINFANFKKNHAFAVLLSLATGVGVAVLGYLQAQPASTIFQALSSLASFKTFAIGVAMVAVSALVHLVQGSVVAPPSLPPAGARGLDLRAAEVPPAPPPRNLRRALAAVTMACFGVMLWACLTSSELSKVKTVTDMLGNGCQIVVTATDPSLPPLCTTADVIANALEAFLAASPSPDGGAGASAGASRDAVYAWVATHGGTKVAAQ